MNYYYIDEKVLGKMLKVKDEKQLDALYEDYLVEETKIATAVIYDFLKSKGISEERVSDFFNKTGNVLDLAAQQINNDQNPDVLKDQSSQVKEEFKDIDALFTDELDQKIGDTLNSYRKSYYDSALSKLGSEEVADINKYLDSVEKLVEETKKDNAGLETPITVEPLPTPVGESVLPKPTTVVEVGPASTLPEALAEPAVPAMTVPAAPEPVDVTVEPTPAQLSTSAPEPAPIPATPNGMPTPAAIYPPQ